jgi:hypothetical protein
MNKIKSDGVLDAVARGGFSYDNIWIGNYN